MTTFSRGLPDKSLLGTWRLKTFAHIAEDGTEQVWNGQLNGYLIYTADGLVTAAINRWQTRDCHKEFQNSFYVAAVTTKDRQTLEHKIVSSSDHTRIGTTHLRKFCFDNNDLVLAGRGLTGMVKLRWRRELFG